MNRFRRSNPVMGYVERRETSLTSESVTYSNVAIKTIFLIGVMFLSAYLTLTYVLEDIQITTLILAIVVGFISVMIGTRNPALAPYASIVYAICEGALLGVISLMFAILYEGIVPTALLTTIVVFLVMLILYATRVIKVTQGFLSVIVVGLISVIIMSLLSMILPYGNGSFYYLTVFLSAALSALFLLADFASIERCVDSGADRRYGWVLSLGLLVTLVWVYINILRILAIFMRRD